MGPNRIKTRQHAEKVLNELGITNVPINLETILKYHDLALLPFDESLLKVNGKISAFIDHSNSTIFYNNKHHEHRIRFSIAHELGHYLMKHKTVPKELDYDSQSLEELEANMFASELLIPFKWLKVDMGKKIKIPEIAEKYNVSVEVATRRLLQSDSLLGTKSIF